MALRPCRECGEQISTAANACPYCGCKRRNAGVGDGIFACVFGVLGIFTMFSIVFVPLAALFSLGAIFGGLFGRKTLLFGRQERNPTAVSLGMVGSLLTIVGFLGSPSLWLLAAGLMGAARNDESATSAAPPASSPAMLSPRALAPGPASDATDPHASPEDHNPYYCKSIRLDYPYTRTCPEPWVTVASAESKGEYNPLISCGSGGCFPMEDSDAARAAVAKANAGNLREAAAGLVTYLFQLNNSAVAHIGDFYADQVFYYGKLASRQAVVDDKVRFATRWPDRKYQIRSGTLVSDCDQASTTCKVEGIVDWETRSPARGASSTGSARFSYTLNTAGKSLTIISENSSVLRRNQ